MNTTARYRSDTMASTPSVETLTAENMELYQRNLLLMTEVQELEDMVVALQKKIRTLLDHVPAGALPAPTFFGAPKHLPGTGAGGVESAAPQGWIVDAIPGLHRTYANLSDTGTWAYWEQLPDGRYKWNPKWVEDNE